MKRAETPGREREGREGKVGKEGAGWGGVERRTSRWGEGLQRLGDSPSYWKRRASWRREGRKQNLAWHVTLGGNTDRRGHDSAGVEG